jgi:hypothetical protein
MKPIVGAILLLGGFCLAVAPDVYPAAPLPVTTVGAASDTCKQWTAGRDEPGVRYQYRQWIFGFVSGYNWHDPSRQIVPPDSSAIIEWIDNYCQANPSHALYSAAAALAKQMAKPTQPAKKP